MNYNMKPNHFGISVANLEESIAWYSTHLGYELESINDFPEINTKLAFVKKDDFRIELFEHYETQSIADYRKHPLTDMKYQGNLHICFCMEDGLEALFENFKATGVDIVMGPMLSPPKDAIMGFIRDNTGNLIEIIEPLKNQEND